MSYERFSEQLKQLGAIISDAVAYFSVWQALMVSDPDPLRALNRYKGFFLPARNALIWMALGQLAKVFDRHPKTASLRNLLKAAIDNAGELTPHCSTEELEQIRLELSTIEPLLKRLDRVRHKRFAHHQAFVSGDMPLRYGETKQLVESVKSMYNSLRHGHDKHFTIFDSWAKDAERHTQAVVGIMLKQIQPIAASLAPSSAQQRLPRVTT